MRLNSQQLERTLDQFDAQPIPEDHPVVARLHEVFGDHTFFLDTSGLNVVEPDGSGNGETCNVVKLADWSDDKLTKLTPHAPEATDVVIRLGPAN